MRQRVATGCPREGAGRRGDLFGARTFRLTPPRRRFPHWINPETVDLLFTDPTGKKLLAYAMASVVVGTLVIRWMVRRETMV